MQNPCSKTFWTLNFYLFVKPIFKIFVANFRTKGMLNHDKICMRVIHSVVKNLLLKDLAYRVVHNLLTFYQILTSPTLLAGHRV